MSEFRIDQIKSQDGKEGPNIAGITTFTGTSGIVIPSGDTNYRGGRGRGIVYGGYTPGHVRNIDHIHIASTGNAVQFGNDPTPSMQMAANSSSTRMIFGGGSTPSPTTIRYIEIAHFGNSMEFSNLSYNRRGTGATGNSVRGLFAGGADNPSGNTFARVIDYTNYASYGNTLKFGDLSLARRQGAACGSPTRGVFTGGYNGASPYNRYNVIDYVTITSEGNAIDFGDLTSLRGAIGAGSNATRGFIPGGTTAAGGGNDTNVIDYLTITSTGNTSEFGDLIVTVHNTGVCSSQTRAVFAGGYAANPPTSPGTNVISYVEIPTLGDSQDFGDLTAARSAGNDGASSDSHGGLG